MDKDCKKILEKIYNRLWWIALWLVLIILSK